MIEGDLKMPGATVFLTALCDFKCVSICQACFPHYVAGHMILVDPSSPLTCLFLFSLL